MKQNLLVGIGLFICTFTFSQTVDTTALQSYPSSVIIKVYDVATKISLTSSEQILLAELLKQQEQRLASAVFNGNSSKYIDSLKQRNVGEFNSLLGMPQADEYYTKSVSGKAVTIARLNANMLQWKYGTDTIMQRYFTDIYTWRETLMERIWLRHADTVKRNNNLAQTIYQYDSLLSTYLRVAEGGSYVGSRIHFLDSIQTINSAKKSALANTFYEDCMLHTDRAFADNFNNSFSTVFNTMSDTVYYAALYKGEIVKNTMSSTQNVIAGYLRQKISTYAALQITPIITQRERIIALVNKMYPVYTNEKDSLIDTIVAFYQPQIDSLIKNEGSIVNANTTQIDIAIRYALEMELAEEKVDQLKSAQTMLNDLRAHFSAENEEGEFDSKQYESEQLNTILSPDQYTYVLTTKYEAKAGAMARQDWSEMIRLQLSQDYDSTTAVTELTNYHLATLIAYYRNAYNLEEQYLSVKRIQEVMPSVMRSLMEKWEYRTPYGDTPDLFYQW